MEERNSLVAQKRQVLVRVVQMGKWGVQGLPCRRVSSALRLSLRVNTSIGSGIQKMVLKRHPHTPAHLFLDETPYFITGGIYRKRPLLAQPEAKLYLLQLFQEFFQLYAWEFQHWVILDNHYHVMGQSRQGKDLTAIFRGVHSKAAIFISQTTQGDKPIWWNYWDYCPRDEADYMTRLNYLLLNPIKHGYVTQLQNYPFSSFHALFSQVGRSRLVEQMENYPDYKQLILHEAHRDDF